MRARKAVVAGTIVLAAVAGCSPAIDGPERNRGSGSRTGPSLLYLRGTTLTRLDLESGSTTKVGDFPTPDVHAAPVQPYVAYVVGGAEDGSPEDFVANPELRVLDIESRDEAPVGDGVTPVWNAAGDRVAYLRPTDARRCEGEVCTGLRRVMTFDPGSRRSTAVSPPGRWTLLGWAGDRILASDPSDLSTTASLGRDGIVRLPVAPSEVWGVSPDGRWLLATRPEGTWFTELDLRGLPTGEVVEVPLEGRPADGQWTADSRDLAVVVLEPGGGAHVAVFGPESPRPRPIPGSEGAAGQLLWLGDKQVVLTRVAPGGRLTTSLCPLDGKGCRRLFSWSRGVVLLRSEERGNPRAE